MMMTADENKTLRQEVYLLREELSGLREMLEGVTAALAGAQRAYAAVAQRADILDKRLTKTTFAAHENP